MRAASCASSATSGAKRSIASVPTFKEAGLDASIGWNIAYAKPGMAAPMVDRLSREIGAVMAEDKVRQQFLAANTEPAHLDAKATQKMLEAFKAQWVPAVKASGLQFDSISSASR
jgi:tripartite-type tricarboxylate transporter receptor subunit TctC